MIRELVTLTRSRIAFLAHRLHWENENLIALSALFADAVVRTISETAEAEAAYLDALQEVCATR